MDELFASVTPGRSSTPDMIARAEAAMGIDFPPSYRAFCLRFGTGMIGDLIYVFAPRDDLEDGWSITSASRHFGDLFDQVKEGCREDDLVFGVDYWEGIDDPGIMDRAVFFGYSIDGHRLLWDVKGGSEYDIYVELKSDLRFGGRDLLEFIRGCQGPEVKGILGSGYEPLPSRFEGHA